MSTGPLTRAERTHYRETSLHSDVQDFIRDLSARTGLIHVASMGTSGQGQDMPVLVISGTKTFTPEDALRKKKLVVMVIANIHAGEVEGKEACLMLARDLTLGKRPEFLKDLVLVVVPNYNPDGNDRIDVKNRALDLKKLEGQIGPEGGVGTRYTGVGINLNRDYMKLEAVESRHLSKLYGRWRPHLFIDCHTTDGSIHGYHLTFDTAHNPASGAPGPIAFVRDTLLPDVSRRLEKRAKFRTFFYGNWRDQDDPTKGWETYPGLPRYGSHYRGLTGRCDVLLEAYSYADFKTRCDVMVAILRELFDQAHKRASVIRRIVEAADADTIARGLKPWPEDRVGINYGLPLRDAQGRLIYRYPAYAKGPPVKFWGWDIESQKERRLPGRKLQRWSADHYCLFFPEVRVRRPFAYVIEASCARVIETLRAHNIVVEELSKDALVPCETYHVLGKDQTVSPDVGTAERFESVFFVRSERTVLAASKGDLVVRMAQPLANLAIYLLEPQSDDGLVRWNFFDHVKTGSPFPVRRVPEPVDLPTAQTAARPRA